MTLVPPDPLTELLRRRGALAAQLAALDIEIAVTQRDNIQTTAAATIVAAVRGMRAQLDAVALNLAGRVDQADTLIAALRAQVDALEADLRALLAREREAGGGSGGL